MPTNLVAAHRRSLTIVLLVLIGVLTDKAGYKRQFSLTDTSIQHTYAVHERITFGSSPLFSLSVCLRTAHTEPRSSPKIGECIVYAGIIPLVLMALIALVWRRSFWDLHASVLGLLLSVSLTTVFTQVVKVRFQSRSERENKPKLKLGEFPLPPPPPPGLRRTTAPGLD